ncbi:LysR family transcriptional regulator [Roseibium sp. MMSF_3544]|uniref:LysR family transcriptional regulator n=1 Tax=unclassified Roseibium TaxID=2629323 RepID=UPI00273F38B7|nr:LysR family transcriptional regulator [Roseibium sp. MMSF_3544]
MAISLPPLNWFRAFEAAARNLSFTAAAEEIGMTQSAVSQQVKSLELRLGVPLFERKARGLALTDHARRLLPQVDTALATLTTATDAFVTDQEKELLTVSASVSVIQWVIAPLLPDFTDDHSDISLRLISAVWPDEFTRIAADVEIRFGSQKQAGEEARLLGSDRLIALKAPGLQGRIEDLPLIEAVGISDGWKSWARATGAATKPPALFVDSYGPALQLAVHGNGVCLVHELLAAHPRQQGLIELAHDVPVPAHESYYLSVKSDTKAARAFSDWISGTVGQLLSSGANTKSPPAKRGK